MLAERVDNAARVAGRIGSDVLAVMIAGDPDRPAAMQLATVRDNLRAMADVAVGTRRNPGDRAKSGVAEHAARLVRSGVGLIEDVGASNVQLIFDTAHASAVCEDSLATFEQCYASIALIQIVDEPGRVDPDARTSGFPFEAMLASAMRRGFAGLVDLEFAWSERSEAGQRAGLDRFRQLDAAAAHAAQSA